MHWERKEVDTYVEEFYKGKDALLKSREHKKSKDTNSVIGCLIMTAMLAGKYKSHTYGRLLQNKCAIKKHATKK